MAYGFPMVPGPPRTSMAIPVNGATAGWLAIERPLNHGAHRFIRWPAIRLPRRADLGRLPRRARLG